MAATFSGKRSTYCIILPRTFTPKIEVVVQSLHLQTYCTGKICIKVIKQDAVYTLQMMPKYRELCLRDY